jgi:hypothetical protein
MQKEIFLLNSNKIHTITDVTILSHLFDYLIKNNSCHTKHNPKMQSNRSRSDKQPHPSSVLFIGTSKRLKCPKGLIHRKQKCWVVGSDAAYRIDPSVFDLILTRHPRWCMLAFLSHRIICKRTDANCSPHPGVFQDIESTEKQ